MIINFDKRKQEILDLNGANLTFWQKLLWQNSSIQMNQRYPNLDKIISEFAEIQWEQLVEKCKDEKFFEISTENNKSLEKIFQGEVAAHRARGEEDVAISMERNKESELKHLSSICSNKQYEEIQHLISELGDYPAEFKYLILNEALSKTYRMDFSKGEPLVLENKRTIGETVQGIMGLPSDVISSIYNATNTPLDGSVKFKDLYKQAQIEHNKSLVSENKITLEGVNTFGKGKWIKFDSKEADPKNFEKNVDNLKTLVADTPWCTATLASQHLSEGDFYVFVDNAGKAHIAVKMSGEEIGEVRGIKNGSAQELEEDYRDVAIDFLQNNKDIKNGMEWLDKEEWNKRLIDYNEKLNADYKFSDDEMKTLLQDIDKEDFRSHFSQNSHLDTLKNNPKLIPYVAKHFKCKESEVCLGDFVCDAGNCCPYVVIVGRGNFRQADNLGKLKYITFLELEDNKKITTLGDVEVISRLNATDTCLQDLGKTKKLRIISLDGNKEIITLGNVEVTEILYARGTVLQDLGKTKKLRKLHLERNKEITTLGDIEVTGELNANDTILQDLGKTKKLKSLMLSGNEGLTTLGDVEVTDDLFVDNTDLQDLGKTKKLKNLHLYVNKKITTLGDVEVTDDLKASNTILQDLGKTKKLKSLHLFSNKEISTLGDVKVIYVLDARFTKIQDLGKTEKLAYLYLSGNKEIKSLGDVEITKVLEASGTNLQDIGKTNPEKCQIEMSNTPYEKAQQEKNNKDLGKDKEK